MRISILCEWYLFFIERREPFRFGCRPSFRAYIVQRNDVQASFVLHGRPVHSSSFAVHSNWKFRKFFTERKQHLNALESSALLSFVIFDTRFKAMHEHPQINQPPEANNEPDFSSFFTSVTYLFCGIGFAIISVWRMFFVLLRFSND